MLSVVINTKNSASTLEAALNSVSFADEIVVVDMHSTDDTVKIAKQFTKQVFEHEDVGYVEPARNFAIHKAQHDWILILDSDEEISSELQEVVSQITGQSSRSRLSSNQEINLDADCYYLPRKNIIFGEWMRTGWWPDYVLRLFRKGHVEWSDEIHSIPVTTGTVVELPAKEELAIVHHNYQTVEQYLERLNRYTSIEAANHSHDSRELPIVTADIFRHFSDEFLRRLFADHGINDGAHGMSLSLLQSMYQVVTKLKIWQEHEFGVSPESDQRDTIEAIREFQQDLNYWIADWQVENSSGPAKLIWQLRRKFQL